MTTEAPTAESLRTIALSTAIRRQAALELRFITDYQLYAEAEYIYRSISEVLKQVDNEAEPEGTDVRMHWLLTDLVLVRHEMQRRLKLGQPISKDGGKQLGDFAHDLKARIELPLFLASIRAVPDLRRSGDHMVGRCPHHADKTPSLHVWNSHSHCLVPETRVLTESLEWVPLGDLRVGDSLIAFDEHSAGGGFDRRFRQAEVLATGVQQLPCVTIQMESGRKATCTTDHSWLVRNGGSVVWRRTDRMRSGRVLDLMSRQRHDDSWLAGYVAGILDGEGSLVASRKTPILTITQKPGMVLDTVLNILDSWKVAYSQSLDNRGVMHVQVGGKDSVMKLLSRTRPPRLMAKFHPEMLGRLRHNFGPREDRVVSVIPAGKQDVVLIKTSTGTFIADGLAAHNCFGCHTSMDIYDWITVDGCSWVEAVKIAAAYAGVAMPQPPPLIDDRAAKLIQSQFV